MSTCYQPINRFCYNYKAQGVIQPCCPPIVSASNQYLSSISCTTSVIYGQSKTNQGVFLLNKQQDIIQAAQSTIIGNTVQSTINNASTITAQVQSQLIQIGQERYIPYQPYIPPVMPVSVTQLQMASVNVGVPMSFFTMSDCKGNQSVLKSESTVSIPTNIVALPYDRSALVSFTSSGATYYTITSLPGNIVTIGTLSPILVTGLINGSLYSFIATATNASGTSVSSAPSVSVLVNPIPLAPKNLVAAPSSGSASISFTPPLYALTYTITSNPGGIFATGTSSPILLTGLTNGITYTFTMTATNASGTSPVSIPSAPVLFNPIPLAPTSLQVMPSSGSVSITFVPSLYAISYTITSSPNNITASGTSSPIVVTGLTNGTSYIFTMTATNASGTSDPSDPSALVLVNPVPFAPTNLQVIPSSGSVSISFSYPLYAISYTITSSPGGITASGTSSPIVVTGLTNGTSYTFTTIATNASGISPVSNSLSVLVNPVPLPPTSVVATPNGSGSASITFVPSILAIYYVVTSSPNNISVSGSSSPIIVSGLTPGTYTFTVIATNTTGASIPAISPPVIV